jgi:hypothetical protein
MEHSMLHREVFQMTQLPGDLLCDSERQRKAARAAVVRIVCRYLERAERLPTAARYEVSTRQAIAARVLQRIAADEYAAVREWRRRRSRARDHCSWSSLLQVLTVQEALAYLDGDGLDRGPIDPGTVHHRDPQ